MYFHSEQVTVSSVQVMVILYLLYKLRKRMISNLALDLDIINVLQKSNMIKKKPKLTLYLIVM